VGAALALSADDGAADKVVRWKVVPAALLAKLRSGDAAEMRAGLDDARLEGPKAAVAAQVIAGLLGAGLSYPLAEAALDTLGDIDGPDGPEAIAPYTRHRDLKVRRAAVRALARTTAPAWQSLAATTLRASLSDPDSDVRALAATGLGTLKVTDAVGDLFLALDHHVWEAAVSIGQLCQVAQCGIFVDRLGKLPFHVMVTGLDPILFRPSSEMSDDEKIGIIHRVRDLGTRDVNNFLRHVQGRWPAASRKVRKELDDAVTATSASPGSDE
jgi:hypothetical protein